MILRTGEVRVSRQEETARVVAVDTRAVDGLALHHEPCHSRRRHSATDDRDLKSAFPLLHFHACDDCAADEN